MSEIKIISKLEKIPIYPLHIQYVPVVTPINIWESNMALVDSPHVELIQAIKKVGFDWGVLMQTRYAKVRQHRRKCGLVKWTDKKIKDHIMVRWSIYNSIKKNGFKKSKCKEKPVIVLKEPFWKTRFGFNAPWIHGHEIWDGAGRTTAMYHTGHEYVWGVWAEDAKPGTGDKGCFENKLKDVKGVWND